MSNHQTPHSLAQLVKGIPDTRNMQKKTKQTRPRKPSWLESMFCCGVTQEEKPEGKPTVRRRNTTIKKKAKIQLSLIGSPVKFCLCKLTRKNVAIDSYKFKGVLPNQVNRYLSERIRGQVAVFAGEISSIATRNILFPVFLLDQHPGAPSPLGEVVVGTPKTFSSKKVDFFVYRPAATLTSSLTTNNPETAKPIGPELVHLCKSFSRLVMLLPSDIILDQLGLMLPSLPNNQVQVESIMINGQCILYVVYIGEPEWIRVFQEDKLEAVVRELNAGHGQEQDIRQLLDMMLQNVDIDQILKLLVQAIGEEKVFDTNLNAFLRLVALNSIVSTGEIEKLFKATNLGLMNNSNTPVISPTGQFGRLTTFKQEQLLNRGQKQISHTYQIQSNFEEEFTLYGNAIEEEEK